MDNITEGYKKTEIGVIPEDWEVKAIGDVSKIFGRIGFRGYTVNDIVEEDEGAISLSPSNIHDNTINFKDSTYISWEKYEESPEIKIYNGDVILVKTGSTVGKVAMIKNLRKKATLNPQIVVFKKINIKNDLFFYLLISKLVQDQLKTVTVGGALPTLSQKQVEKFKIPLSRSKDESIAIADSLSDIDSLITSLEKLIDKKKMIKQGVMQELLTGKRRLAGFSGKWKEMELSDIGKTYGGLSGKVKSDFGHGNARYIPFMNIMNNPIIDTSFLEKVNIKPSESQIRVQKGDLFFNGSSETPEEVGMCSVIKDEIYDLYLNSFCFGFRLKTQYKTNGLWLTYYFRSNVGRELIFSLAQGATRYNLSKTNFVKLKISYPVPEEQIAIANVINDVDFEISELESKLSKLKQIKQGAMQQLLTGKIRLINK